MNRSRTFKLKVWGRNACFTRPEMKAERVSYDVMTPAAARGVLEAISWARHSVARDTDRRAESHQMGVSAPERSRQDDVARLALPLR